MDSDYRTFTLLNVRVGVLTVDRAAARLLKMASSRRRGYVCVAPVSTLVDARLDPDYCRVVNAAEMVTPDGVPVVWMGRFKGFRDIQRTYGPDLMQAVCDQGRASGLRHFFYGGTPEVCDKLVRFLKEKYPGIVVAGAVAPPYMKRAELISAGHREQIERSGADVLWVGLGSPKQDFWMSLNREGLSVPVMVGIGAAFDFLAGVKPQAPLWMQHSGLEWLFRLVCEPRRLWKRYLVGNTRFLWWVLTEEIFKGKS